MKLKTFKQLTFMSLVLGACVSSAVQAQSFDSVRLFGAAPGADGGLVGIGAVMSSQYRGSDERRNMVVPLIDYQWSNGWFAGTSNGIGYNFSKDPAINYGVRLTADFGRDEGRSKALRGMGDIKPKAELGGFLNYSLSRQFTLTSSLRYGSMDNNKGGVLDLGAVYSFMLSPNVRLAIGAATSVVDSNYMQTNFGVTKEQSIRTGYAMYTPNGGVRDIRASGSMSYIINPRTSITTALSYSQLSNEASNSPITRKKDSFTGVIAAAYAF